MRVEIGELALDLTETQVSDLREQLGVELPDRWLSAAELAKSLGVSREFVYAHAGDLGGEQLGDGPRPRWRFPAKPPEPASPAGPSKPKPRRRQRSGGVRLLAVRGEPSYAGPTNKAAPGGVVAPTEGLDTGGGSSHARKQS